MHGDSLFTPLGFPSAPLSVIQGFIPLPGGCRPAGALCCTVRPKGDRFIGLQMLGWLIGKHHVCPFPVLRG